LHAQFLHGFKEERNSGIVVDVIRRFHY
jgi:hypothetical protein